MTWAIEPKSRADEDKLAPAVHKLMEEDPMLRFFRDQQTNEFLIAGVGPVPHRIPRQQAAPPLPHRSHAQSPARALSRNHPRSRRRSGPPQKTDRRPRPVRRLQNQNGAAPARRAASSSSTTSSAEPSPATSFPLSKKAFRSQPPAATSPAIPSSTSASPSTTAATTTSTPTSCPSKWPGASPSANAWSRPSPPCSNPS